MLELLLQYGIEMRQWQNNLCQYSSAYCPFCGNTAPKSYRYLVYHSKKHICKCFSCGISFKEKHRMEENLKYLKWLEDKDALQYGRCFKCEEELVEEDDDLRLPF